MVLLGRESRQGPGSSSQYQAMKGYIYLFGVHGIPNRNLFRFFSFLSFVFFFKVSALETIQLNAFSSDLIQRRNGLDGPSRKSEQQLRKLPVWTMQSCFHPSPSPAQAQL